MEMKNWDYFDEAWVILGCWGVVSGFDDILGKDFGFTFLGDSFVGKIFETS